MPSAKFSKKMKGYYLSTESKEMQVYDIIKDSSNQEIKDILNVFNIKDIELFLRTKKLNKLNE